MADAGYILAGPFGRELLGFGQVFFLVFICASHVLTGRLCLLSKTKVTYHTKKQV